MAKKILAAFLILSFAACGAAWAKRAAGTWKTRSFFNYNFSLESPFDLKADKSLRGKDRFFASGEGGGVQALLVVSFLKDASEKMDITAAPQSLFKDLADRKILTGVKAHDLRWECSGFPAMVSNGTGKDARGRERRLKAFNVSTFPYWWSLVLTYDPKDPVQENTADRIVASFKVLD